MTRWSESLGASSLALFVLCIALSTAGMYLGLLGMTIATLGVAPRFWPWARSQVVFWPALALSAWVLVCFAMPSPYGVPAETTADATRDLLRVAGIPALITGWWMVHQRCRWPMLFTLAAIGMALTVLLHFDWSDPGTYLAGRRPALGIGKNGTSLYGGVLLIGCLTLGRDFVLPRDSRCAPSAWSLSVWAVLMVLGVLMLVVGQSRSVWLASIAVLGLIGLVSFRWYGVRAWLRGIRSHWPYLVGIGVTGMILVVVFGPLIIERVLRESETWAALFALQFDQVPSGSIGFRVAMWRIALEQIAAYPLTGVGPGAAETILAVTDDAILGDRTFPHFHNAYLEAAVSLGIPGLLLSLVVLAALALSASRALFRQTLMDRSLARFSLVCGSLIAITSLFQIRFDDPSGMALFVFMGGCALACSDQRGECDRNQSSSSRHAAGTHPG